MQKNKERIISIRANCGCGFDIEPYIGNPSTVNILGNGDHMGNYVCDTQICQEHRRQCYDILVKLVQKDNAFRLHRIAKVCQLEEK